MEGSPIRARSWVRDQAWQRGASLSFELINVKVITKLDPHRETQELIEQAFMQIAIKILSHNGLRTLITVLGIGVSFFLTTAQFGLLVGWCNTNSRADPPRGCGHLGGRGANSCVRLRNRDPAESRVFRCGTSKA